MHRPWLRIAHRGASGEAPEHTRRAFLRALDHGVDMIELDVHLSRDGELIVIHDDVLERTTNGRGLVREHELPGLRALDVGAWFGPAFAGESILTLGEVVALVDGRARLNVELKSPRADWRGQALQLSDVLRRADIVGSTVVSCFDPEALAVLRDVEPAAQLGLLWADADVEVAWDWARRLAAISFHPHWTLTAEATVNAAHERGLLVLTWTVNEVEVMEDLLAAGVDGIITDYPDRFAALHRPGTPSP
ncbi:MAG: hypothetical protein L6Q38_12625 [Nitrospira sp.]|nr:hypothetical protein [Nitrospira sp.]MCK6556554.1 glycerophosphodiester phosphodiesterase [Candidatus Binatia bacterium]